MFGNTKCRNPECRHDLRDVLTDMSILQGWEGMVDFTCPKCGWENEVTYEFELVHLEVEEG